MPNVTVRRLTSFPKAYVDTTCSLSLTKRDLDSDKQLGFGDQSGGSPKGGVQLRISGPEGPQFRLMSHGRGGSPGPRRRRGEADREWRRGNDVPRKDVALRGRQVGSDRQIGVRHFAKHGLHGGRMALHPFQPLSRINGLWPGRFLGASAVQLADGGSHRIGKSPPGFLLAGFGSNAHFEIGELRREESASFRAWPALLQGRRIGLRIHGAESPKPGTGKGDDKNRGSLAPADRKDMTRSPVQTFWSEAGTSRAVFPADIPIVAEDDKTRLALALEMFGYKFVLACFVDLR